jgi:hypothetical protein
LHSLPTDSGAALAIADKSVLVVNADDMARRSPQR